MREWEEDLYRYRLTPAPEKLPLQTYIEQYLDTGEDIYLTHFLHFYERTINYMATGYVERYAMQGHFGDIKSSCVLGIMTALRSYKKEKGPFVPYARYEIKRAVDDYIRTMRTGYTIPNDSEYYMLRKAMRLFAEHGNRTDDVTITAIAEAIHREPKTVIEMLRGGLLNMQLADFYRKYTDDDSEETAEDVTCDMSIEPCSILIRDELSCVVFEAFRSLDLRKRIMLSAHMGFCPECFSIRDKDGNPLSRQKYQDIMLQFGLSSQDTVHTACWDALDEMEGCVKSYLSDEGETANNISTENS